MIKINYIKRSDAKKDGTPYVDKENKPFYLVSVGFDGVDGFRVYFDRDGETEGWEKGKIVNVRMAGTADFKTFKILKGESKSDNILEIVTANNVLLANILAKLGEDKGVGAKTEDGQNIPF